MPFSFRTLRRLTVRFLIVLMILAVAGLGLNPVKAASPNDRDSLRGFKGVQVVIGNITENAQNDGLTQDSVRTAVELILRSSGIKILTSPETRAAPILYVRVNAYRNEVGTYGINMSVSFRQWVSLLSDSHETVYATTWERSTVGTVGKTMIKLVIGPIEDLVKEFANDFLTVNPR